MRIAMQGPCGQCGGNHQGDKGWFPRKLEIRSRGGELPLNLEGRGSLLTRSLKMKVFWAEGAAGVKTGGEKAWCMFAWRARGRQCTQL